MSNSVGGKGGDCLKKEKEFNNVNTFKCFREVKERVRNLGKHTDENTVRSLFGLETEYHAGLQDE